MVETPISVLYAFARSGGTLLNRCLGSIPQNFVLSEINPHASVISIESQLLSRNLITEEQCRLLANKDYMSKLIYSFDIVNTSGGRFLIRDWPSVNYLPNPIPGDILSASRILEQHLYLSRYGFDIRSLVLARRAADVYESIVRTFEQFEYLSIEEFGEGYLAYAKSVCEFPVIHYEDFCQYPKANMQEVCSTLDLAYHESFLTDFNLFQECTGDTRLETPSRGMRSPTITPLASDAEAPAYISARSDRNCIEADRLLGYDD